jgi:hypothetical protein
MCTLSQKNAVNEYFVHTEADLAKTDAGQWGKFKDYIFQKPKPMAHDGNAATVDNGNLTQETGACRGKRRNESLVILNRNVFRKNARARNTDQGTERTKKGLRGRNSQA